MGLATYLNVSIVKVIGALSKLYKGIKDKHIQIFESQQVYTI